MAERLLRCKDGSEAGNKLICEDKGDKFDDGFRFLGSSALKSPYKMTFTWL